MQKLSYLFAATIISLLVCSGCMTKELTPEEKAVVEKTNAQLPFGVAINGNDAKPYSTIAALIEEPVSIDSEIICDIVNDDIINITFFPCDKEGIVIPGKKPALIIIRDGSKTTLNKTIDGKKLTSGFYIMDATSGDITSRIVIEIQ